MKSVVFGKSIKHVYSVNRNVEIMNIKGEEKEVYVGKPALNKKSEIDEWLYILDFDGELHYNSSVAFGGREFNISENESVIFEKQIFRADLNEVHIYTNKIVKEVDIDKEFSEKNYKWNIKQFNKQMIESNERLKAYCDIHKLSYEETDCIELFKLVYPKEEYYFTNGRMKVKEKPVYTYDAACSAATTIFNDSVSTLSTNACLCADVNGTICW